MTSLFEVDAADERHVRLASQKSVVAAKQRIDDYCGKWLRQATTQDELAERIDYVYPDILNLAKSACEEYGGSDEEGVLESVLTSYAITPEPKTASVHESRKPKMCPFHKEVVDISLASQDPRAGYDSLAQHWGGPRHCEGDGYEGGKCNFKPAMTTQTYWDEKAEKAEQRRQEREEQAQLEVETPEIGEEVEPVTEEPAEVETIDSDGEGAEVIPFPSQEPVDAPEATETVEEPMAMAASVEKLAPGKQHLPGASDKRNRQYEHIKEQLIEDGKSEEEAKEEAARTVNKQRQEHGETKDSKTADKDVTGLGETETPINKDKWTPKNVQFIDVDDDDGPNPTRQKDIIEPIKPQQGTRFDPSKVTEIGEQVTERQDVTQDFSGTGSGPTKTFDKGDQADPVTAAKIPDDVDKNPITALVQGEYDGFLPAHTVQQAIAAHRR